MDLIWIGLQWIEFDYIGFCLDWISLEFDCIEWGWVWVVLDWIGVLFGTLDGSGCSKWFAEKAPGVLCSVLRDSKNRILDT